MPGEEETGGRGEVQGGEGQAACLAAVRMLRPPDQEPHSAPDTQSTVLRARIGHRSGPRAGEPSRMSQLCNAEGAQ